MTPTTTLPTSDIPIATVPQLLTRAVELRADAVQARDTPTLKALDRVIVALSCGAQCWWADGVLCVTSINTPGAIYALSCGVCSCEARKPCWHMQLLDLVIELADTAAGDADFEADADELATTDDTDDGESGASAYTDAEEAFTARLTPSPLHPFTLSPYAVKRLILLPLIRKSAARLAVLRSDQRRTMGRRLTTARAAHPGYSRPLFAARDAEDARLADKGEMRAQLEIVQAKRAAARAATQAMNALY